MIVARGEPVTHTARRGIFGDDGGGGLVGSCRGHRAGAGPTRATSQSMHVSRGGASWKAAMHFPVRTTSAVRSLVAGTESKSAPR